MQNYHKRTEYQTKIRNIDRKLAWMLYDVLKVRLDEVKQLKNKSQVELQKKRDEIAPMQGAVNNAKKMIDKMQEKITNFVSHNFFSKSTIVCSNFFCI